MPIILRSYKRQVKMTDGGVLEPEFVISEKEIPLSTLIHVQQSLALDTQTQIDLKDGSRIFIKLVVAIDPTEQVSEIHHLTVEDRS